MPASSSQACGPVISGRRERWHCSRAAAATRRRRASVPSPNTPRRPQRCSRKRMAETPSSVAFSTSHEARSGRNVGDQQLEPERGLAGRRRIAERHGRGGAVDARHLAPAGAAAAVHHAQAVAHRHPAGAEEVACRPRPRPSASPRVELVGRGEESDGVHQVPLPARPGRRPTRPPRGDRAPRRPSGRSVRPAPVAALGQDAGKDRLAARPQPADQAGHLRQDLLRDHVDQRRSNRGSSRSAAERAGEEQRPEAVQAPIVAGVERRGRVDVVGRPPGAAPRAGRRRRGCRCRCPRRGRAGREVHASRAAPGQAGRLVAAGAEGRAGGQAQQPASVGDLGGGLLRLARIDEEGLAPPGTAAPVSR